MTRSRRLSGYLRYKSGNNLARAVLSRAAVVLALAVLAAAGMIAAGAAPNAWACSDSNGANHCYAEAQINTPVVNWGAEGSINLHCLYQPMNGNVATNEVWDVTGDGNYWVEAGAISGITYNGYYQNKNWFWADSRPGGGFHEHDFSNTVPLNTWEFVQIIYARGQKWDVYGGPYYLGQSTYNSMQPVYGEAGSEYLGASNSGIRDIGQVGYLEWIRHNSDGSNTYLSWGNNGYALPIGLSGPGAYIVPQYDATSSVGSLVGWSGPC